MAQSVVLIPGDGIGPEVADAARRILSSVADLDWVVVEAGEECARLHGTPVPPTVFDAVRQAGVALKGPLTNPLSGAYGSPTATIRRGLDLWVNVRLARSFAGAPTKFPGVNIALIRDTVEGLSNGVQQRLNAAAAIGITTTTRAVSERLARFAFEYARRQGRKRVTLAHRATVYKLTDGLLLDATSSVAQQFPDIEFDQMLLDHTCLQLVRAPETFDVLLSGHGDGGILADLCAGLAGSVGLMCGAIYGDDLAVFEAAHGSAPRRAGQNVANPTGLILSGAMLLDHVGEREAARRLTQAVKECIAAGECTTYDIGGSASTSEFAEAVVARLQSTR